MNGHRSILLLIALAVCGSARAEGPLLYLPFDDGTAVPAGLDLSPGIRGMCARINTDCRIKSDGKFDTRAGTVASWIRPQWDGADATGRYLFSLYGSRKLKDPWMKNRWSIHAGSGQLRYWVCGASLKQKASLSASIKDWRSGQWHHVAATWRNTSTGREDAELCLYIDGRLVQRSTPARLDVGAVSDILDIGRDSDASPNYANADYDEFYIYGRALSGEEIRAALELVRGAQADVVLPPRRGRWRTDWWNDAWRFRCRATVARPNPRAAARLPFDLQDDLSALSVSGTVEPASIRIVPCDPRTGECAKLAKPLASAIEDGGIVWRMAPGEAQQVHVYFDVVELDSSTPLFARARRRSWPKAAREESPPAPDYAADTCGDAWDFDEDDFEGIDQWGNRPWCLKNRRVKDGVLSFDVSEDPWFVWGNMWGQVRGRGRPVAIDVAKCPVLAMKVRQSCASAEWEIYGRAEHPGLFHHTFRVDGQGWQTVRVNLAKDARWKGVLRAFRIDPTARVKNAHVEIDWIRLTNEIGAEREAVETLGRPNRQVAGLAVQVERTRVRVRSRHAVIVRATDANGAAVQGQPITVRLATKSDGRLEGSPAHPTLAIDARSRRGLTDEAGQVEMALVAGSRAGLTMDALQAEADFSAVHPAEVSLDTMPGPPHHYRVSPTRAVCVREGEFPLTVNVQLVDESDNGLSIAGRRVALNAPPGATLSARSVITDAHGRGGVSLRIDPKRRWVYWVEARDTEGLSGKSAKFSVALDGPRPNPIRLLPNGYFAYADGRPFVPLGGFYANWVQLETPDGEWRDLRSFTDTTDEDKRRWMKFLHDSGVTAMRFMLRTHRQNGMEPMDVGGRVNQALFAEALRYMDLARELDLKFQLVVHEDYTKPMYHNEKHLRLFALPTFEGENLDVLPKPQQRFIRDRKLLGHISEKYSDPDALACQDMYARELVAQLRGNPQVFAYELENEMVNCPASWANRAIDVIRGVDPTTPVCASHGGGGLSTADPLSWHRRVGMDFYNYHLYPHGGRTTADIDYGAAVDMLTRYGRMCGPCFMGESAGDQWRLHPSVETRRWVMRDIIWMALTSGDPGVFFWNARGPEVREFKPARDAMSNLDLTTFRRAKPEIGIDVRHPSADDKFFRTDAGKRAYAMMGRYAQHYLSQGVDFDFALEPGRYEQHVGLDAFAPPVPKRRCFSTGPGWQLKYLARDDWREALVYIRNFAGVELWECQISRRGRSRPWRQYIRQRKSTPLRIGLDLPDGRYRLRIYDLDEQTVRTREARWNEPIDLGTTQHDFAVVLKRM